MKRWKIRKLKQITKSHHSWNSRRYRRNKYGLEWEDKLFVRNTMSSFLGLSVKIKKTQRIGMFTKERQEKKNYRPIKITMMENESMKKEKVKCYTKHQSDWGYYEKDRDKVKEWQSKVEEKNKLKKSKNFKWHVRGEVHIADCIYLKKIFVKQIVNTSCS